MLALDKIQGVDPEVVTILIAFVRLLFTQDRHDAVRKSQNTLRMTGITNRQDLTPAPESGQITARASGRGIEHHIANRQVRTGPHRRTRRLRRIRRT